MFSGCLRGKEQKNSSAKRSHGLITCVQQQLGNRQDCSGSLSLHTKTVNTGGRPSYNRRTFWAQAPWEDTEASSRLLLSPHSSVQWSLCGARNADGKTQPNTKKKKTPKNKSSYNIMVLMAFKSLQFFPLWLPPMGRYLKWCCEGMWLNIKCHGNGHWFGFGEKFHIIFFIIRCVTSLVSTSGIIWPTY